MKTFLEHMQQQVGCAYDLRTILDNLEEDEIIEEVNTYAKEIAKQTLINASENATIIEGDCGEFGMYTPPLVNKKTILNESNIPEL